MALTVAFAALIIGPWLLGRATQAIRLPAILGMLLFGVAWAALSGDVISFVPGVPAEIDAIAPFIKTTALIVILLRAGLGIRTANLRAVGGSAVRMAVIGIGLLGRSAGVLLSLLPDRRLTWSDRLFALVAYIPKATVQAALGAIPLALGIEGGDVILSVAVLAIVVTAPVGLILIRALGPRLLALPREAVASDAAHHRGK
jgi:NhaP-type Na+/H+ or K+/H+ antiporter